MLPWAKEQSQEPSHAAEVQPGQLVVSGAAREPSVAEIEACQSISDLELLCAQYGFVSGNDAVGSGHPAASKRESSPSGCSEERLFPAAAEAAAADSGSSLRQQDAAVAKAKASHSDGDAPSAPAVARATVQQGEHTAPHGCTAPPGSLEVVFCSKCKVEVSPFKAQLLGKSPGCWKCNVCNCKITQLHRRFGQWPPEEFQLLSEKQQAEFYQAVGQCHTARQVEEHAKLTLAKVIEERHLVGSGGEYLPLSVYDKRGFDTAAIEKHCKDKKNDPIFGLVYRVAIQRSDHVSENSTRHVQELISAGRRKQEEREQTRFKVETQNTANDGALKKEKKKSKRKRDSSSSSSSTSSSDTSSSDSPSQHKKKKKSKSTRQSKKKGKDKQSKKAKHDAQEAAKKAKEKADAMKKQMKQEKQERKRLETESTKRIVRTSPLLAALQRITNDELLHKLPPANVKMLKKMEQQMQTCDEEAKGVLGGSSNCFSCDKEAFEETCALARKELSMCHGLLETIRKHS